MACSKPYYQLLADTINEPSLLWDWAFCPYVMSGLGWTGVGAIVLMTGFIGLKNWSESWTLPMTWLALVAPVLAAGLLGGAVVRRIAGLVTVAFAMVFVGLYYWWGRS